MRCKYLHRCVHALPLLARVVSLGLLLLTSSVLRAAPTSYGTSFRVDTSFLTQLEKDTGFSARAVLAPDGGYYLAGDFTTIGGQSHRYLARMDADGLIDPFFNATTGFDAAISSIVLQPDGKILVAGRFTSFEGTSRGGVARLNDDGTLDVAFATLGSGFDDTVAAIALQGDGKILAAGWFASFNGVARAGIARLNDDGTLDTDFVPSVDGFDEVPRVLAIQSDGKILVGGGFTTAAGVARGGIARLNDDGTLDTSFVPPGAGFDGAVEALLVQADGKILVGGDFTSFNSVALENLVRLNDDGTLDEDFIPPALNGAVKSILIDDDGQILISGLFDTAGLQTRGGVLRLDPDGTLDNAFVPTGSGFDNTVLSLSLDGDGNVTAAGAFKTFNGVSTVAVARLTSEGALDRQLLTSARTAAKANVGLPLSNDRWLIAGDFTHVNGTAAGYVARLLADGDLDSTFFAGDGFNGPVNTGALETSGMIVLAGDFTAYDGVARTRIARLQATGVLDMSYAAAGFGPDASVEVLTLDDGGAVIGGAFTQFGAVARGRIARVKTDGTLDGTFLPPGTGFNGTVKALALQSGAVVAGGTFTAFNGTLRGHIARLNTVGALDVTFVPAAGFNDDVNALLAQADGKVVVGGEFTSFNGQTRNRIERLNADGSSDTGFAPLGARFDGAVNTLLLQTDGKIVAGGGFASFRGTVRDRLARLNTDGSLDALFRTFDLIGSESVRALEFNDNGRLIVCGPSALRSASVRDGVLLLRPESAPAGGASGPGGGGSGGSSAPAASGGGGGGALSVWSVIALAGVTVARLLRRRFGST